MASIWCECPSCRDSRARFEYIPFLGTSDDYLSKPFAAPFEPAPSPVNPFKQAVSDMFDSLAQAKSLPFEPEPAQPEPVYTHVLIDCYDDGGMMGDSADPHTADSLLEAIEARKGQEGRYQVYKLGALILDVAGE